jgi:hypothetical protein
MALKPRIGRIVHFVQNGVHYAAMIVKVWTDTCVNLRVFPNGSDKIVAGALDTNDIAHSVNFSDTCDKCGSGPREWSWHWPEIQ